MGLETTYGLKYVYLEAKNPNRLNYVWEKRIAERNNIFFEF